MLNVEKIVFLFRKNTAPGAIFTTDAHSRDVHFDIAGGVIVNLERGNTALLVY